MASPSIHLIRYIQMARAFPKNVVFQLPGDPPPAPSDQPQTVIPIEFPDMTPYHACLGHFLDEWGKLEIQLKALFQKLLNTDSSRANALSATLSGKALTEALLALAEIALTDESHKTFVRLCERLSALNQRRNYIVHGYWVAEIIIFNERNGGISFRLKVLREYPPASKKARDALANPRNQKERTKHLFQLKHIEKITKDVTALRSTFTTINRNAPSTQTRP